MFIRNLIFFAALGALAVSGLCGTAADKRPVLILLHSRFEDHIAMGVGEDRLFRLLALVETLRKEYPASSASVDCQFSGTFAQRLVATATGQGYADRLRSMAKAGAITIGYSGEHEPTYRNRPKAVLTREMTPEQRWTGEMNAAERFLNDYKDFVTGQPDRSRAGGLRAVRELLGEPEFVAGIAPELGGEAPYYNELRRMGIHAMATGFPDPYYTMNIHGYRVSATETAVKALCPVPEASSELFWDSGVLRASFTSSADVRRLSAEEGKDALKTLLEKLDRTRVRVVQIEVVTYARYLDKWPDGTPKLFPLIWAYDHPEAPEVPSGIHAFLTSAPVQKAYADEEQALRWLLSEFLPANPGSRLVTPAELMKMAKTPVGSEIPAGMLTDAVKDWTARTAKQVNMAATYVQSGGTYFSAADLFQLLANSLSAMTNNWQRPEKVRLTQLYGPIALENADETFPDVSIPAREVARVAARLAPALNDQTPRALPANAVPVRVEIAGKKLIPPQFLALMADAYLAPSPETPIKLRYFQATTAPGFFFPRQNQLVDGGNIWTLRPAPLELHAQ